MTTWGEIIARCEANLAAAERAESGTEASPFTMFDDVAIPDTPFTADDAQRMADVLARTDAASSNVAERLATVAHQLGEVGWRRRAGRAYADIDLLPNT